MALTSEHAALCFEDDNNSCSTDTVSDTYSWFDEIEAEYRNLKETDVPSLPSQTRGITRFSRRWVPRVLIRLTLLNKGSWANLLLDKPIVLHHIENALPAAGPYVPFDDIRIDD